MDNGDKKRFAQIMAGLAEDCGAQLSSAGMTMRFDALRQYSIEQVEAGVMAVIRSNVFTKMPTTGTIIKAIEGTEEDRSEIQIKAIRDEIRRVGLYGSPKFEDPVTADLVSRRFSWGSICAMSDREFEFFARSFKESYLAHKNQACIGNLAVTGPTGDHAKIGMVRSLLENITTGF